MSEREGVRFLLYCGEATRHTRDRVDFPPLLYHNIAMASAGLMEDARPSLSETLAAVATSTVAAVEAAGLTETGGVAGCGPAWNGEANPEDKQRLRGSIVKLVSGNFAYLPVASSSSVIKTFAGRDAEATRAAKIKISLDLTSREDM